MPRRLGIHMETGDKNHGIAPTVSKVNQDQVRWISDGAAYRITFVGKGKGLKGPFHSDTYTVPANGSVLSGSVRGSVGLPGFYKYEVQKIDSSGKPIGQPLDPKVFVED